ncbi:MAG: DNA primase [Actinomycetia bacterium]|nr:DNA primase [Actinomycetes bacterium]
MSRGLKDGEVEELKSRADIIGIISDYVNLKKRGKNHTGLCPFHQEKTPSFSVDSSRQFYHCFGCGEGGDAISFIMKIENLDFLESVEFIAKKIGYQLKYSSSGSSKTRKLKERLFELNQLAKTYYHFVLNNPKAGSKVLKYLKERGFNGETLEEFEVGYSLKKWDYFSNLAQKRGYRADELIEAGLSIRSKNRQQGIYDRFRERIMFPIGDVVGKTIGFGGRILEQGKSQSAKYINTPETRIYSKSKNIYNIHRAKNYIVEKDKVFIVEGYTDVMALSQCGIKNVVASLGTALTTDQIKLLGRFTKNVGLVFDSDQAGLSASMKGMERLREYNQNLDLYHESNMNIEVVLLEQGYDPADYVFKKGSKAFMEKVNSAENIIDFTIAIIIKKYDLSSLNQKVRASKELLAFISTLNSRIVQEECVKKIARELDLKEDLLFEELVNFKNREDKGNSYSVPEKSSAIIDSPQKKLEVEALRLMVNGEGLSQNCFLGLEESFFKYEDTKKLFNILMKVLKKQDSGQINFPVEITSELLKDSEVRKLYNFIYYDPKSYKNGKVTCDEVLCNLKLSYLSEKINGLRNKMLQIEEGIKKGKTDQELSRQYDRLYSQLIELEQEKIKLKIS